VVPPVLTGGGVRTNQCVTGAVFENFRNAMWGDGIWARIEQSKILPMIGDTLSHTSVSEILHLPLNVLQHAHAEEEKKYTVFNETQESWISFKIISFLYTVLTFVGQIVRFRYLIRLDSALRGWDLIPWIIFQIVDGLLMIIYWAIIYLRRNDRGNTLNARKAVNIDSYKGSSWKVRLQNIFIIGITLELAYWLIIRVSNGQCEQTLSFDNFRCNPNQDRYGLPIETLILLMLLPMTFCVAFRGTPFKVQLVSWVIAVAAMFSTAAFVRINQNLPYLLVYVPTSLFVIYESERQNKVIYLITERLSHLLEENERLADETHANELRHMVGNVAHDLRTVRAQCLQLLDV
jgi:signal transduction histidine kinase